MDLWQLHILCKVIENKSFSKAGKAINLSQPTISSHIKELEKHFECRLVDRLSKEVCPTKAGELLYDYALKLLALRDEAESAIHQFKGDVKGTLSIGGSTIPGGYILPQVIGKFLKKYPLVKIKLKIDDTKNILEATHSGAIELGVVGARSNSGNIVQTELMSDEMCLIVPRGHKWYGKKAVSPEQLKHEPFIVRDEGSGTLRSIEKSLSHASYTLKDLHIVAQMGNTASVIQGVKSGIGISIISKLAVMDWLESKKIAALRLDTVNLKRSFYITHHKYRSPSPACRAFTTFLKNQAG